jgi:hypothetical protein
VCDPFSLGESAFLRRAFDREAARNTGLRAVLESLLGTSLSAQIDQQRRWVAELHQEAERRLGKLFSLNVRELPEYAPLLELTKAHVEAELLAESCPEQKLRDVLVAARRTIEASVGAMAIKHPVDKVWTRFYSSGKPVEDMQFLSASYTAAAKRIGFAVPLPRALTTVKPGILRSACGGNGWRLRPSILAAVLTASRDQTHPLWKAAAMDPDLLVRLDAIADIAGDAAHANSAPSSQGAFADEVSRIVSAVHHAVALMSGLAAPRGLTSSGS